MPPGNALASAIRRKAWTPSLFDSAGVEATIGSGATQHGEYWLVGDTCEFEFVVILGTGVTFTNAGQIQVTLPISPATGPTGRFPAAIGNIPVGHGSVTDVSLESGTGEASQHHLFWEIDTATSRIKATHSQRPSATGTTILFGTAEPYTLAVSDRIAGRGSYPVSLTAL